MAGVMGSKSIRWRPSWAALGAFARIQRETGQERKDDRPFFRYLQLRRAFGRTTVMAHGQPRRLTARLDEGLSYPDGVSEQGARSC